MRAASARRVSTFCDPGTVRIALPLTKIPAHAEPPREPAAGPPPHAEEYLGRGRSQYLADITERGRQLNRGES